MAIDVEIPHRDIPEVAQPDFRVNKPSMMESLGKIFKHWLSGGSERVSLGTTPEAKAAQDRLKQSPSNR